MDSILHTLSLPDGCPAATAGVVLPGGREAVIGLANGDVYKWDVRDGSYEKMLEGYSSISAIDMREGTLLVGSRDGPLFTIDAESYRTETLREWSQSKSSRIWKCAWLDDGRAVMTSTCGGIYVYERRDGGAWNHSQLHGHARSVLAVGVRDGLMATGDRTGRIVVWTRRGGSYSASTSIRGMSGAAEALAWVDGRTLAGIDENGLIRQFEKDPASDGWAAGYELDVAAGRGTSMHLADDKKTLLASTEAEVVQVDLETMWYKAFPLKGAVGISSEGDTAYIVAADGVHTLPIDTVEEPPGTVQYRNIRVSLVGHTGVGKSTLCSTMAEAAAGRRAKGEVAGSTSGQRVWQVKIKGGEEAGARRAMLHDCGGQGSVPPAFLRASEDSDVVLALFKQTDRSAFDAARESLRGMRAAGRGGAPRRFLVATHADSGVGVVTDGDLRRAVEDGGADGYLRIDARAEDGAREVEGLLRDARLWDGAGRVVKSELAGAVEAALDRLKSAVDRPVLGLDEIRSASEGLARTTIPEAHLDCLLKGMDRRGLLTYYGEIRQVVLGDADHDVVRSGIPMLAGRSNGIVEKDRIEREYGASRYTEPILSALRASGAFVKCRDRMVFPHLLRDGPVDVPDWFSERLQNPMFAETLAFDAESVDAAELISAAASLNLPCVDATRTGALFASKGGAGLYYDISPTGDPIEGLHTLIAYRVGGTRRVFCESLAGEFAVLARRIAGPEMLQRIEAPAASAQ